MSDYYRINFLIFIKHILKKCKIFVDKFLRILYNLGMPKIISQHF